MTLSEKIQSMRGTLGVEYTKPPKDKLNKLIENLENSTKAKDYLEITRGINSDTYKHFKLGYDIDKDAIAIPIFKKDELVNIKYRLLDPEAKMKYTQEKGCEVWLFNDDGVSVGQAKGGVLVVEGEFDCISAWQAGLKNVISPASGKDSYGVWIELLDTIPKVYISYDNDKPGKKAGLDIAERVGTDKCFEVQYPEDIKDANEYLKKYTAEDYRNIIRKAKPYYSYKFKGLGDVIELMREKKENLFKFDCIPFVEFEEDWIAVISGVSNGGKTSHLLNVANELANKKIPTLILPFERGIKTVGKRFLQVRCDKSQLELDTLSSSELDELVDDVIDLPLYFSMPNREQIRDTIARAKKIFGTKVVIVDHLDYLVRKSGENHNVETSNTLQEFKSLAQEFNILFLIVHHIKKQSGVGGVPKKPSMEDLKGSSSTYQDPEAVIMLSSPEFGQLEVDIVKNKGEMGSKIYVFNTKTGRVGKEVGLTPTILKDGTEIAPRALTLDDF